jgi:hypothetical protein
VEHYRHKPLIWKQRRDNAMIPDRLVDFVHGAVVAFIGTRDARLRPTATWAFGARVSATTDEISAFVPDIEFDQTRSNLVHNSIVAYTVSDPISTESYQFKGKLAGMRPTTEEERAVQAILRGKLAAKLAMFPPEFVTGYTFVPSTALTFKVEQVFVQTPGPGAGRQLDLSTEL